MRKVVIEVLTAVMLSGAGSFLVVWKTEAVHDSRMKSIEAEQQAQKQVAEDNYKVLYNIQGQVQSIADGVKSLRDDIRSLRK